jgi:hypothetical protein
MAKARGITQDLVNAFQKLEDPAQGSPLRRLVDLIRYRCIVVG